MEKNIVLLPEKATPASQLISGTRDHRYLLDQLKAKGLSIRSDAALLFVPVGTPAHPPNKSNDEPKENIATPEHLPNKYNDEPKENKTKRKRKACHELRISEDPVFFGNDVLEECPLPSRGLAERRKKSILRPRELEASCEESLSSKPSLGEFDAKDHDNQHKEALCKEKPFTGEQRPAEFVSKDQFNQHLETHTTKELYTCELCSFQVKKKYMLKRHMISHSVVKTYPCQECRAQFFHFSSLRRHLSVHTGNRPYVCKQCHAQFGDSSSLKKHLISHSDERPFACGRCDSRFKTPSALKRHQICHSDQRQLICEQCHLQFKTSNTLERHLCDKKLFHCEKCLAKFPTESSLRHHVCSQSEEILFSCEHCSAKFKRKQLLRQHIASHIQEIKKEEIHPEKEPVKSPKNATGGEKNSPSFEQKPIRIAKRGSSNHQKHYYMQENLFSCRLCPAQFLDKNGIDRHMPIHFD